MHSLQASVAFGASPSVLWLAALFCVLVPAQGSAQSPAPPTVRPALRTSVTPLASDSLHQPLQGDLPGLLSLAEQSNPRLRAAEARVRAANARIGPAASRPDPSLMAGVVNLPVSNPSFSREMMTMKMVGVMQTLPYPGKLSLLKRAAEHQRDAAEAALLATQRQVEYDVRAAYYQLAFLDKAIDVMARNQQVLGDFTRVAEASYSTGSAQQADIINVRMEATRLAEQAVTLTERRRSALVSLNAILDRPGENAVTDTRLPSRVVHAAVADSAQNIRFVSAALGARAADSPLRPLEDVQELALRESPVLIEQEQLIAAQQARVAFAQREHFPDFSLSLQYGQRSGRSAMMSATVSVPIPLQKQSKQDQIVAEAEEELTALQADQANRQNELRAEVARLYAELERQRAQLALYVKAMLPQAHASLASTTASYQAGRSAFAALLDSQAILFTYETEYFRQLSDFARTLAELERVVGSEVLK